MAARRRAGSFSPKTSRRLRISKVDMLYGQACLLSALSRLAISRPGTALLPRRGLLIPARRLLLEQCVKHCGPPMLQVHVPIDSELYESLVSLLRLPPS